jgi:hypothetical protein
MTVQLGPPWNVGDIAAGKRRVFGIEGGTLEGERVNGRLLASGTDSTLVRPDGTTTIDARQVAELDDGFLLYILARGMVRIPPKVQEAASTRAKLVALDPASYYYRFFHTYETSSPKYSWLNTVQAVGTGWFVETGVAADVFEII